MIALRQSKLGLLLAGFVMTGCARFEPALRYSDLMRPREPTVQEAREGLEVSVEEFASKRKSEQAFDADIASAGVLALVVRVENGTPKTYRVRSSEVSAYIGTEALPSVTGESASKQSAESEYLGKALGLTLAAGPILFPAMILTSVSHTATVNRRIEQHFESLRLADSLLKPNQIATGFVYFKLPTGIKRLENLSVEVTPTEEETGEKESFKLTLPTLYLAGPGAASSGDVSSQAQAGPHD